MEISSSASLPRTLAANSRRIRCSSSSRSCAKHAVGNVGWSQGVGQGKGGGFLAARSLAASAAASCKRREAASRLSSPRWRMASRLAASAFRRRPRDSSSSASRLIVKATSFSWVLLPVVTKSRHHRRQQEELQQPGRFCSGGKETRGALGDAPLNLQLERGLTFGLVAVEALLDADASLGRGAHRPPFGRLLHHLEDGIGLRGRLNDRPTREKLSGLGIIGRREKRTAASPSMACLAQNSRATAV